MENTQMSSPWDIMSNRKIKQLKLKFTLTEIDKVNPI